MCETEGCKISIVGSGCRTRGQTVETRGIKVQGQAGPNSEFQCNLSCVSRSCLETCLETTEWLSFLCLSIPIHTPRGNPCTQSLSDP